jgi:hypothetical protein
MLLPAQQESVGGFADKLIETTSENEQWEELPCERKDSPEQPVVEVAKKEEPMRFLKRLCCKNPKKNIKNRASPYAKLRWPLRTVPRETPPV